MDASHVTELILQYKYWVLVPLAIVEGPIVAFVAGTLSAPGLGYFNIYEMALFFFLREMIMDGGYYAIGYFGGKTSFASRMLAKLSITKDHIADVRNLWEKYPGRTMFIGKISYGIASTFIMVAGVIRMQLRKFFGWGTVAAVAQYGTLLLVGYFFGNSFGGKIGNIINDLEYLFLGASVVAILYYFGAKRVKKDLLTKDSHEHEEEKRD